MRFYKNPFEVKLLKIYLKIQENAFDFMVLEPRLGINVHGITAILVRNKEKSSVGSSVFYNK